MYFNAYFALDKYVDFSFIHFGAPTKTCPASSHIGNTSQKTFYANEA